MFGGVCVYCIILENYIWFWLYDISRLCSHWLSFIVMLRKLSYAIENQGQILPYAGFLWHHYEALDQWERSNVGARPMRAKAGYMTCWGRPESPSSSGAWSDSPGNLRASPPWRRSRTATNRQGTLERGQGSDFAYFKGTFRDIFRGEFIILINKFNKIFCCLQEGVIIFASEKVWVRT